MNTDKDHFSLSPSAAHRWLVCPGEVAAREGAPQDTSNFAEEGTTAHWLAARCLKKDDKANRKDPRDFVGQICKETGLTIPSDMCYPVSIYVDDCRKIMEHADLSGVEARFSLHSYSEKAGGTTDFWAFKNNTLYIRDLKYGVGVDVDPEQNEQALMYALGALEAVRELYHDPQIERVNIGITQPRITLEEDYMIKVWEISLWDLEEWADKKLIPAIKQVKDSPTKRIAGDHCFFCPVRHNCPELKSHNLTLTKFVPKTLTLPPVESIPFEELERILEGKALLTSWLKAIEHHVYNELSAGVPSKAFKLVARRTNRKWTSSATQSVERILGENAYHPAKMLSVAQAEEMIKQLGLSLPSELFVKTDNGTTLAPIFDKRRAVVPISLLEDIFDDEGLLD